MGEPRTIIVGAGLAGLAAASRLAEKGRKVTVVEATKGGGGRSRSFDDAKTGRHIDNGQHLMMACYHETKAFLRRVNADADAVYYQRNLTVDMVREGGQEVRLSCPSLPAPFHLGAGLLRMRGIGALHKLAALRAGLMLRGEVLRPDDNETCDAWLSRLGQTPAIRQAFWEPLIWAVLNDDPLVASAAMLVAVLDRAFLGTRDESSLGVPRLPMNELYLDDSVDYVRSRGGEVRFASAARELLFDGDRAVGVRLKSGEEVAGSDVVTAVPPAALLDLLPTTARDHVVFRDVARLEVSPIVNLWALLDRPVLGGKPFVGTINGHVHWLFDRDVIERRPSDDGHLLSVTISGARGFVMDDAEALEGLLAAELARFFPHRPAKILRFRAVKEKRATISHAAGTYQRRPETRSPIKGLLLAGDWVRTGLPATIESAVQSGHDAARVLFEG